MKFVHVIALGEGTVPYRDETGRMHPGRAMGRAADGTPTAERVADTTYVRRAIGRGELATVTEPEPVTEPELAEAQPPATLEEN